MVNYLYLSFIGALIIGFWWIERDVDKQLDKYEKEMKSFRESIKYDRMYIDDVLKKQNQILEYSKPHIDQMWSATICGIILDCEFRDAKSKITEEKL